MNYNMFNHIVEINGKVSKATIWKVPHKGEFHLYNHRKSNYRRNVYVFLVYGIELSHLINSGNVHEKASHNHQYTDSTSQFDYCTTLFHDGHRTRLTDLFLYGLIFDYKMLNQSCLSLMNCFCMCELTPTRER
jgi:hypothetical protein